jgi:hypothetical protein
MLKAEAQDKPYTLPPPEELKGAAGAPASVCPAKHLVLSRQTFWQLREYAVVFLVLVACQVAQNAKEWPTFAEHMSQASSRCNDWFVGTLHNNLYHTYRT